MSIKQVIGFKEEYADKELMGRVPRRIAGIGRQNGMLGSLFFSCLAYQNLHTSIDHSLQYCKKTVKPVKYWRGTALGQ